MADTIKSIEPPGQYSVTELKRSAKSLRNKYESFYARRNDTNKLEAADDFEQFCLLAMIKSKRIYLNYQYMISRFLESNQTSKSYSRRAWKEFREHRPECTVNVKRPNRGEASYQQQDGLLVKDIIKRLGKIDKISRAVTILIICYNFKPGEIAELFGEDPSYISFRIKKILAKFQ